jgi:hypothetical protein
MKTRRTLKSIAAAILAVGLLTAGVAAPADAAATTPKRPGHTTFDTGWG